MQKTKKSWLLIITIIATIVLIAYSGYVLTESKQQAVFKMMATSEIKTIDSTHAIDSQSLTAIGNVQEGLYRRNANDSYQLALAKYDPSISQDRKTWIIQLKDINWSDGVPLTSHDFVYSWRRAVDPNENAAYGYLFDNVIKNAKAIRSGQLPVEELGIHALDERTLEIQLEHPVPYFKQLLAHPTFFPLRQDIVEHSSSGFGENSDDIVYIGPYLMKDWTKNVKEWEFVKNEHYYDVKNVEVSSIHVKVIQNEEDAIQQFEQGKLDYVLVSNQNLLQYAHDMRFTRLPLNVAYFLTLNMNDNITGNQSVRKAIALSINKKAYVDYILKDGSEYSKGLIPSDFFEDDETNREFRAASGERLNYDPILAQTYLKRALDELNTLEISIELITEPNEKSRATSRFIKTQIEDALKQVTIQIIEKKSTSHLLATNEQMKIIGWTADYADPMTFLELFTSSNPNNFGQYQSTEYDQLIEAINQSDKHSNRFDRLIEAEHFLMEDAPIIPLYHMNESLLLNERIKELAFQPVGLEYDLKTLRIK